jgi:hypothetical protein
MARLASSPRPREVIHLDRHRKSMPASISYEPQLLDLPSSPLPDQGFSLIKSCVYMGLIILVVWSLRSCKRRVRFRWATGYMPSCVKRGRFVD